MDALPAVCSAGECADSKREVRGGDGVGGNAGAMVSTGEAGQGARARAGGCSNRAAQANLSFPLCAEGGAAAGAGGYVASDAGLRGDTGHCPAQPGGRRRRSASDVKWRSAQ